MISYLKFIYFVICVKYLWNSLHTIVLYWCYIKLNWGIIANKMKNLCFSVHMQSWLNTYIFFQNEKVELNCSSHNITLIILSFQTWPNFLWILYGSWRDPMLVFYDWGKVIDQQVYQGTWRKSLHGFKKNAPILCWDSWEAGVYVLWLRPNENYGYGNFHWCFVLCYHCINYDRFNEPNDKETS